MSNDANTEQIIKDLKTLARDAEELGRATAGELSERARDARERLATALETAKESCQRWEEKALEGARATDRAIHEHPYQSLGIAFALGALAGVLLMRK
jgi:ElaB/YqjD/DUF883 family membrane-anchored ribosome-binding protein